eukprot:scaffold40971_cov14-Tisochrysis_lutea.AAC.1
MCPCMSALLASSLLNYHLPLGQLGAKAQRPPGPPPVFGAAGPEALALLAESKMRCGGCGAKGGTGALQQRVSSGQSTELSEALVQRRCKTL